jgi:hypothetical protein
MTAFGASVLIIRDRAHRIVAQVDRPEVPPVRREAGDPGGGEQARDRAARLSRFIRE